MKYKENTTMQSSYVQLMGQDYLKSLSQIKGFWNEDMETSVQTTHLPHLLAAEDILNRFRGLTFQDIRSSTLCFLLKLPYPDLILSRETCLRISCSSDVPRGSLISLKREILTPKSLSYKGSRDGTRRLHDR